MSAWIGSAVAITVMMLGLWGVSLAKENVSIVDAFWGPGFALVAWVSATAPGEPMTARGWLLVALVTLWAIRLGVYLAWRNHGKAEDWRYRQMREAHGRRWPLRSLFIVFGLQGALMYVVALPLITGITAASDTPWGPIDAVGLGLWLLGFVFETFGDLQLARFRADPANQGQVMDRGLWRFTRHPNYFGDFSMWWGLATLALVAGAPAWTLVSPLVMSTLLLRVSGVTLLEQGMSKRKPGYAEYVARTSTFFPWPPRRP